MRKPCKTCGGSGEVTAHTKECLALQEQGVLFFMGCVCPLVNCKTCGGTGNRGRLTKPPTLG